MQSFLKLEVWKKAHQFVLDVYDVSKNFPKDELFALTKQLRKAAVSIPANIAEGCGKRTRKDLSNFLNISLGSAHECEYYILLSKDLAYLDFNKYMKLNNEINRIKAMLINFINRLAENTKQV